MKKMVVVLFALMLLLSLTVVSEASEYSSLSLEELVKAGNEIEAEISSSVGPTLSIIRSGKYIAGKQIKAGIYTLTCLETFSGDTCRVETYEGEDYIGFVHLSVGESTTVFLKEDPNMDIALSIDDGTCSIALAQPGWAS